jgi:hypothetical protein
MSFHLFSVGMFGKHDMNAFCSEITTSKTWFRDIVSELSIERIVSESALRLFLYVQDKPDPSVIEECFIKTSQGAWLLCALILCHKYLEDNEYEQFNNLLYIKSSFFHNQRACWPSLEMHYLQKLDFRLGHFFERVRFLLDCI